MAKRWLAAWIVASCVSHGWIIAAAADAPLPTYGQERDFLAKHTQVVELVDEQGARVAVCPQWQGRVMTSTCTGEEGPSFGWINRPFIEAGKANKQFNNYGGEDRFWLGPEAGQFGLFFAPGAKQEFTAWTTPPGLNAGAFRLVSQPGDPFYRLTRRMQLTNASETSFDLAVTRDVRLLSRRQFADLFGPRAGEALETGALRMVGFETRNAIANRGEPWSANTGLLSIWILGMFHPGERNVIVVPYRAGDESELGPVVESSYFGELPAERLRVTPSAILFAGDGKYRSKIGTSQRRARPFAGAIDFDRGLLTLVHFSMPEKPADHRYVNNLWDLPQNKPYVGDVFNSYNDGPTEPGAESLGGFYELETLSPTRELPTGQSLIHHHRTFHFLGELADLAALARAALDIDLDEARKFADDRLAAPK